jgi:hypothetical protein
MARPNPRNRIQQLAREAERAIAEQQANTLPSDHELTARATVHRSDVDRALEFGRRANAGSPIERLLEGPAGQGEQDG